MPFSVCSHSELHICVYCSILFNLSTLLSSICKHTEETDRVFITDKYKMWFDISNFFSGFAFWNPDMESVLRLDKIKAIMLARSNRTLPQAELSLLVSVSSMSFYLHFNLQVLFSSYPLRPTHCFSLCWSFKDYLLL